MRNKSIFMILYFFLVRSFQSHVDFGLHLLMQFTNPNSLDFVALLWVDRYWAYKRITFVNSLLIDALSFMSGKWKFIEHTIFIWWWIKHFKMQMQLQINNQFESNPILNLKKKLKYFFFSFMPPNVNPKFES